MNRFEKLLIIVLGLFLVTTVVTVKKASATSHEIATRQAKVRATAKSLPAAKNKSLPADQIKASPQKTGTVNWKKSSENKPYPSFTTYPAAYIKVSIAKQRVYIMNGTTVLYTMYASTGTKNSPTPTGTFHIQKERGKFFYNAASKEGARYYTSFKDHGIYLFHTVPTNQSGKYIKSEADRLGQEANSHGCVRLTIPDAKWIYEKVPEGTKVEIH